MRIQTLCLILLSFLFSIRLTAQCTDTYMRVLGTKSSNERGYAIDASPTEKVVYAVAAQEDSIIIVKLDSLGQLLWTRRIEIEENRSEYVNGMVLDEEGMIGIVGTVGNINQEGNCFVARYDPVANTVLWSQRMISQSTGFASGIIELDDSYIVLNNPTQNNNKAEVVQVWKSDGAINNNFAKHYDVGDSETISDMVYSNGTLYGVGRFTDGGSFPNMRTAIVSMNPANGEQYWTRLGHRPSSASARLYGYDILVIDDAIYAVADGDDNGASLNATEVYIQKLDLEGNMEWVKRYNLPGGNDWADEMVEVPGGIVIMARNRVSPSDIILFKINLIGDVVWAKRYNHDVNDNSVSLGGISSQMVVLEDHIYYTAFADNTDADILLVRTDLEGNVSDECDEVEAIEIPVTDIPDAVFYEIIPTVNNFVPERIILSPNDGVDIDINELLACGIPAAVITSSDVEICEGEEFEGYTESGTFMDTFQTSRGCDSIRTLRLTVITCDPCAGEPYSAVFGEEGVDENAECLVASSNEEAIYIAGRREQNTLLIKLNYDNEIIWVREFDFIKGDEEVPCGIIEDSEGLLVISGTGRNYSNGGSVYAFRYDPVNNLILWANEYQQSQNDMNFGLIEKGPGGNFLFNNLARHISINNEYAEVVEIDRNTGQVNPGFDINFKIIGTETLYEVGWHNGALYGVGRYKDGGTNDRMRHTLTRLNPTNGSQIWVKMGHRSVSQGARLYGTAMSFADNSIVTIYHGDPVGTSTVAVKTYIQRTDLNGNLLWLNQYEFPGGTDWSMDLANSADGGIIAQCLQGSTGNYILFEIDIDGNLRWAKSISINALISGTPLNRASTQLLEAGDYIYFTGIGTNSAGDNDMVIVRTDLEGNVLDGCVESEDVNIQVLSVDNISWYNKTVIEISESHNVTVRQSEIAELSIPAVACSENADTTIVEIEVTICAGQSYEGYTESGIYQDTFQTTEGCDSIRILTLEVIPAISTTLYRELCVGESFEGYSQTGVYSDTFELISGCDSIRTLRLVVFTCEPIVYYDLDACRSYMSDGSIMDYSEFDPEYPNGLDCGNVSASILFREPPAENKHSCTPGLEGSLAMCISALNSCTYTPGHDASAVIEVTFTPDADSTIAFNKIEFFEKAPTTYTWIDGPSGVNNYPRFYGIRILRNGTQIFEQHDIPTSQNWSLESYVFTNDEDFRITAPTTFRIELLPYCPIGNGADVAAWDLENIRLFASCAPELPDDLFVGGEVKRWNDKPVFPTTLYVSERPDFAGALQSQVDLDGKYTLTGLTQYNSYYIRAENNLNLLLGVNTADIIALQKHLLGKQPLTTLDQHIAADINHNGKINALDQVDLRKAILGMATEFPNNTSWRFGTMPMNTASHQMHDFEEVYYIESLFASATDVDFMGVKIGDINRDLRLNFDSDDIVIRSANPYVLEISERPNTGEGIRILDVTADEAARMEGLQIALSLNDMELLTVVQGTLPLHEEFYHVDEAGVLRISWSDIRGVQHVLGQPLFSLVVKSNKGMPATKRLTLADVLTPELYTVTESRPVEINVATTVINPAVSIPDMQIAPNPFSHEFTVSFTVPKEGNVSMQVFTPLGELLFDEEVMYAAGSHQKTIQLLQCKGMQGLLFCQLTYGSIAQTKRVLRF